MEISKRDTSPASLPLGGKQGKPITELFKLTGLGQDPLGLGCTRWRGAAWMMEGQGKALSGLDGIRKQVQKHPRKTKDARRQGNGKCTENDAL